MKRILLFFFCCLPVCFSAYAQNVFNPADPIIRYNSSSPLGSSQHPNPAINGLQKWVTTPTNGVSIGAGAFNVTSFKAYYAKFAGMGKGVAFRLKFPKSYNNPDSAGKKYPVMLFFHGAGETGCPTNGGIYNNEKQLLLGGKLFSDRVDNNEFDGFLLYPQMVPEGSCWGSWGTNKNVYYSTIIGILDSMMQYARADIDRVTVDGLSAGGNAAWKIAEFFPHRIAGIAPSSSAGMRINYGTFIHIPMWLATGSKDSSPSPAAGQYTQNQVQTLGGDITYTLFEGLGHNCWYSHWKAPGFVSFLNSSHKANPLVFFQRYEICPDSVINVKLGISQGMYEYEWKNGGTIIARSIGGTNTILQPSTVASFTGNEITVKQYGVYSVRFKRSSVSDWSVWSPKPAVIKAKTTTVTAPITISGLHSKVLPSLDGRTTVPLQLKDGFINYQWYRSNDNVLIATNRIYEAPVGSYKGKYAEPYGCGTSFSPVFTVVNANGSPKPAPATLLNAVPASLTSVRLNWVDDVNATVKETGFEIYRSTNANGPYEFLGITAANVVSYIDHGLNSNTVYYYVVRAVNNTGAALPSNQAVVKTLVDNTPPSVPLNLEYRGSTLNSISLRWNTSTDEIGVKRYDIYADGVKLFSSATSSFTVTGLDSLTSYTFSVKAVDAAGNESAASNQVAGFTHRQGLNYKYFNGNWTRLPDFNALTAVKSGVTDTVSITSGIRTQNNGFGFLWQGYIYIPVKATYTFETYSDDGSKLYVDTAYSYTAPALVNNDNVHTNAFKSGTITLNQGYHRIAVAYFDASGPEVLQLLWSNNAGLHKERIPKNFFCYTPVSLPQAPAAPSSFTAVLEKPDKIKLSWIDNSTNENGFELSRSTSATGVFVPIVTLGANTRTYTDSGLATNKTYYYKLRAVGPGGESPFVQANAFVPSVPVSSTPVAPTQLTGNIAGPGSATLNWNDNSTNETGFQIWRSDGDSSHFRIIATTNANNNAYTDTTLQAFVRYYYYVAGVNTSGSGKPSNRIELSTGNKAPVIGTINNITIKTGDSLFVNFTVTDSPGDIFTVSITNKPSFIKLEKIVGTNYRMTLKPTNGDLGWHTITVVAKDSLGAIAEKTVTIHVSDKIIRSVFVNFGNSSSPASQPWTNWFGTKPANSSISSLKDENSQTTTFKVTMITPWTRTTSLGHITGNNSGVFPDNVLVSGIADTSAVHQIRFTGLNPLKRYNFVFVGSQNEGIDASARYSSGTQVDTLNARYNTNQTANVNGLVPNASGQIDVNIQRIPSTGLTYLNALVIEEYDPSVKIVNPANLFAETVNRTSIELTWSDRANNENAVGGYELKRATDSLFQHNLKTITLPANSDSYRDTGLSSDTKYWYGVRAKNGSATYSGYSNSVFAITPESEVYVNFNYTVPSAATPWNNTITTPVSPVTFTNLYNTSGNTTGISLSIDSIFNGEFNAGMNTGNNSGVVPDNVLMSNYWIDNTQVAQIRVSGLNQTKRYRFGFTGSSGPSGWYKGNYTATYTVNGRTVYLNSWMNTSKVVYIDNIIPDVNGEAIIDFSTTNEAAYGFNAGLMIDQFNIHDSDGVNGNGNLPDNNDSTNNNDQPQPIVHYPFSLRMYPNPFTDLINLEVSTDSLISKLHARVFDLNGKMVYQQVYTQVEKGKHTLRLNFYNGSPGRGIFFITLSTDGKLKKTVKMVRMK